MCVGLISEATSSRSASEGSLALLSESLTSSTRGFIVIVVIVNLEMLRISLDSAFVKYT